MKEQRAFATIAIIMLVASVTRAAPVVLINNQTPGYYNAAIGNTLNGTSAAFPATADPTLDFPTAPNLSSAQTQLGQWLQNPPQLLPPYWTAAAVQVPLQWTVNTETAVVYRLDAPAGGLTNLVMRFGADNGIFVWFDGGYLGGFLRPGIAVLGEHQFTIPFVAAGTHYIQILREDHGYAAGYAVEVSAEVSTATVGFRPLTTHQHNPGIGPQAVTSLQRTPGGLCQFICSTAVTGRICIVSWCTDLKQWFPLIQFIATTQGTEVSDTPTQLGKFFRATFLPVGVSVATNFDYPIGSGDVLEQITLERNSDDLFPDYPRTPAIRRSTAQNANWRNAQDVGNYYSALGGIHPGEDWNKGSSSDDKGEPVKAVANGTVVDIRPAFPNYLSAGGYVVLIRHWLPNGGSVDSLYAHVAQGTIGGNPNLQGAIGSDETAFTYSEGSPVAKGDVIGVIANITDLLPGATELISPHLHFEMRTKPVNPDGPDGFWPQDTNNGYYGPIVPNENDDGRRYSGMTLQEVTAAFALMQQDGVIDPSDFIDDHR